MSEANVTWALGRAACTAVEMADTSAVSCAAAFGSVTGASISRLQPSVRVARVRAAWAWARGHEAGILPDVRVVGLPRRVLVAEGHPRTARVRVAVELRAQGPCHRHSIVKTRAGNRQKTKDIGEKMLKVVAPKTASVVVLLQSYRAQM